MEKLARGRSLLRLAWLGAVAAVAAILLLWAYAEREYRAVERRAMRAEVQDDVALLAAELQGVVDRNIQLVQGLVAVISFEPDIVRGRFARLAAQVLSASSEIRHVAAAPDLVIRRVYPLRGNHEILGLDYRDLPDQMPGVEQARELGVTVLTGPVDLVQGGRGFVARSPVFVDDELGTRRFWGIISTVIEPERLYAAAGLDAPDLGIAVALAAKDRPAGAAPFHGDPAILEADPVIAEVTMPHGAWQVAALPAGGWAAPPTPWGLRALFALAAVGVVVPIIGSARAAESRRRKVAVIREREAELSRLSWRLEFALAASEVGVWDVDLATDELIWDDRVRTLFGYPEREGFFSEADWAGALHPEDRERALAEAGEAVHRSGRFVSEYRIVRPDGEIRHIRDMASVYLAPDGTRRLVGLLWDVTADVERQQELDLRRREAEAATSAKSRFLAAMSHEIRTPMSGVLGLLGLMLEEPLPEKQRERAEIALASARGLLQILNDILDFSKLEAALIRLNEEEVAIRPLLDEVVALMAAGAAQKGIALTCAVAEAVPERIVTDGMRLRQVLTNLLSNAAKFTEAGTISVRADYAPQDRGRRHRHRHRPRPDRPGVRAVRAGRHLADPPHRRHRARPRDRQAARRADGRRHLGEERAGRGQRLRLLDPRPARWRRAGRGRRAVAGRGRVADAAAGAARRGQCDQPVSDHRVPARRRAQPGDRDRWRRRGRGGDRRRFRRRPDGRADAGARRPRGDAGDPGAAGAGRAGAGDRPDRQRHVR
jgi:sensor domain CHASE-containing protein